MRKYPSYTPHEVKKILLFDSSKEVKRILSEVVMLEKKKYTISELDKIKALLNN